MRRAKILKEEEGGKDKMMGLMCHESKNEGDLEGAWDTRRSDMVKG